VRSTASGFTFLKHPASVEIPAQPPARNDLFQVVLQAVRFMGIAVALPEFGTEHPSPDQLKVVVDQLISNHFFSQVVGGISSAERRFQPVDSHSAVDRSFGASCVRFDAKVAEHGAFLASTARHCHQPELFQQFSMCPPTTYVCQEQFGMDQLRRGLP